MATDPNRAGTDGDALVARAITYRFRICERCRREWPAAQEQCPSCTRWLGKAPLERTEWQLSPASSSDDAGGSYCESVGVALSLRVLGSEPSAASLRQAGSFMTSLFMGLPSLERLVSSPSYGWIAWCPTAETAVLVANELSARLTARREAFLATTPPLAGMRWGMWLDTYLARCSPGRTPRFAPTVLSHIFDFEPDDAVFASEAIFQQTRRWEQFISVPIRRSAPGIAYAFRAMGHKAPSALDHLQVAPLTAFVGREDDLAWLDAAWRMRDFGRRTVAIIAPAGTGKTRLLNEWMARRPEAHVVRATFSLFGGDLMSFVEQIVTLAHTPESTSALIYTVCDRIRREHVEMFVIDDLHWANREAIEFLKRLLSLLPASDLVVVICTRPSGEAVLDQFRPVAELRLAPLPQANIETLARALGLDESATMHLEADAHGNPLFVEQFAAWAIESGYTGEGPAPRTLSDVVAARISLLETVRLRELRRLATWTSDRWTLGSIGRELAQMETTIGLWLDRLETGDYADRGEVLGYLATLERIQLDVLVLRSIIGLSAGTRSNRIAESMERLLLGNAEAILAQLRERQNSGDVAQSARVFTEASRAATAAMQNYEWTIASEFLRIARDSAPEPERPKIDERLRVCVRHLDACVIHIDAGTAAAALRRIDDRPAVDPVELPELWLQLAYATGEDQYRGRAARAAAVVADRAVAEIAGRVVPIGPRARGFE